MIFKIEILFLVDDSSRRIINYIRANDRDEARAIADKYIEGLKKKWHPYSVVLDGFEEFELEEDVDFIEKVL